LARWPSTRPARAGARYNEASRMGMEFQYRDVAKLIDHALLQPG
jgi:hypothetical protein